MGILCVSRQAICLLQMAQVIQHLTPSFAFFENVKAATERSTNPEGKMLEPPIEVG